MLLIWTILVLDESLGLVVLGFEFVKLVSVCLFVSVELLLLVLRLGCCA